MAGGGRSLASPSSPLPSHYHCSSCHHQDLINQHKQGLCCPMTQVESSRGGGKIRVLFRRPRLLLQLQRQPSQSLSCCLSLPTLRTRQLHPTLTPTAPSFLSTLSPVPTAGRGPSRPGQEALCPLLPATLKPSCDCWQGGGH